VSGCPLRSSDQALHCQRYTDQDNDYLNQVLTRDAEKVEAMLGSYSADPNPRSTEVISDDFPSGMVARGTYTVISKVVDLDGAVWLGASILLIARMPYQNNR
jgi:RHO protein GDP dissociation inhibitor